MLRAVTSSDRTACRTVVHDSRPAATTSASRGEVVTSRTGELSVAGDDWTMAAKCLRPLPRRAPQGDARVAGATST